MKKIMVNNRQGNSFRLRFGLLDLLIIVIVAALIITSILRSSNLENIFNVEKKNCEITFVVRELKYDIYNQLNDGETMYFADGNSAGKPLGSLYKGIISSSVFPDAYYTDADGELREVRYPDIYLDDINNEFSEAYYSGKTRYDLSGTVTSELILRDGAYLTEEGTRLTIGTTLRVYTRTVDMTVEITDITIVSAEDKK